MITVEPRREEALKAGFLSLAHRITLDFDDFCSQLAEWDVKAFCDGERVIGMLMTKGAELHVAVLPEVRGKWLSRRLIREVFAPILAEHGQAKTKVASDNACGLDFVRRIRVGFADLTFDPTSALLSVGGSLLSGAIQGGAADSAAQQQAGAANNATQAQLGMFNTQNAQQEPYRYTGQQALGTLLSGTNLGGPYGDVGQGYFTHKFDANDLNSNLAPNYQFMLQQGLGATANQLNAAGGNLSGNALQGINTFAQNYAGNAYQNAFNNYTANQSNIFNRLSTLAGLGSAANQQSSSLAGSLAPGISQSTQAAGSALAGGTVGAANALAGGVNNALGWYNLDNLINLINPSNAAANQFANNGGSVQSLVGEMWGD